jgi:4-amino-4-deoxy-L-arabinose transferase-like glycosyltransferase
MAELNQLVAPPAPSASVSPPPARPTPSRLAAVKVWHVIVAAVAVRLVFCFAYAALFPSPYYGPVAGENYFEAGSDGYIQIARTLIESGQYSFVTGGPAVHNRPPLQPWLLVVFGAWAPHHWAAVWFFGSALLCGLTLLALAGLAKEFGMSREATTLLVFVVGFHPYFVLISKAATFIMAATLLVTLSCYLFFLIRDGRLLPALGCGLACGLGALSHGSFLLLPLVFAALLCLSGVSWKRLAACAVVLLGTAVVVLPWTYRNYRQFASVIPVVTGQGIQYWVGDYCYFGDRQYVPDRVFKEATGRELEIEYTGAKEPRDDAILWQLAKADMKTRPLHTVKRTAVGSFAFWAPWVPVKEKAYICAVLNFPPLLAILALLAVLARRRLVDQRHLVVFLVILYFNLVFGFFTAVISYFIMVLPLLFLLLFALFTAYRRANGAALGV